ncbi:SDR family NAD(P)-dependent oxidoreductase [Nakamurella silvestris]|nr:SDR family NAD(P)-dependent oxidoreductase [Nakamurella silvestris]
MTKVQLTNSRVWIIGASSGIGAALAQELLSRGAKVAISARRAELLEQVSAGRMTTVPVDVVDADSVVAAAQEVREALGGLDIAVLCAGTWEQITLAELDPESFARHLEVNVMGAVHGVAAVLPGMTAQGSGVIAIVASVAGYRGIPGSMAYGASKAAQINFAEAIRPEARRRGIRVVTVNPGFVRTPMTSRNTFPMPFLIDADTAARSIAAGLAGGRQEIVFPLPMAVMMKLARLLPVRVWTFLTGRLTKSAGPRG